MAGKFTKTFYAKMTMGENLGGKRLVRGYDEVERLESKKPAEELERKKTIDAERERYEELMKDKLELDQETLDIEYFESEESEERTIDHLILVIHGIGQKLSERMESINFVRDVNVLRRTIKDMFDTNPPNKVPSQDKVPSRANSTANPPNKIHSRANSTMSRQASTLVDETLPKKLGIQVLPIQWRQEIKFGMASEDTCDLGLQGAEEGQTTLDEITLDGVPTIRMLISDVLMDVLLYMTPRFREQMINTVTKECNRVYNLFLERNPKFLEIGGKVSIYGHSLGSVLAFDVLCHQPLLTPVTPSGIFDEGSDPERQKFHERLTKFDFPVANFFAVGSPIGLFLMLKGLKIGSRRGQHQEQVQEILPPCYPAVRNIYNIFHRADPIAYRLEPLISRRHGTSLKPALIPYHKGGLKAMHIGIQNFGIGIANKATNMFESMKSSFSFGTKKAPQQTDSPPDYEGNSPPLTEDVLYQHSTSFSEKEEDPDGAAKLKSMNVTGRVDYCLQEGILDVSYLNAITVHLSYWSDRDAAHFIMRECHRSMEKEEEEFFHRQAFNLHNLYIKSQTQDTPEDVQPQSNS